MLSGSGVEEHCCSALGCKCSTLDAADRAELGDLSRDAGEGAGIHDVRHILMGLGDFLIHGVAALTADDDAFFLHLANKYAQLIYSCRSRDRARMPPAGSATTI